MKGVSRRRTTALSTNFVAASGSGADGVAQDTLLLNSADLPSRGTVLFTEAIDPAIVDKTIGARRSFSWSAGPVQLQGLVGLLSPKGSAPIQPSAMALASFGF